MLTLNDIINVTFRKTKFSGYHPDDVDAFVDKVKESYDELIRKNIEQKEEMEKQKEEYDQLQKKLEVLAGKIEDYRQEENEIKNALVSAQKLGDASVREARHKAEIIIKDANLKAERIIAGADENVLAQKQELDLLKRETAAFRAHLLETYKQHLTMIDAIPNERPQEIKLTKEPQPQTAPPHTEETGFPDDFHVTIANFDEEQVSADLDPFAHGGDV